MLYTSCVKDCYERCEMFWPRLLLYMRELRFGKKPFLFILFSCLFVCINFLFLWGIAWISIIPAWYTIFLFFFFFLNCWRGVYPVFCTIPICQPISALFAFLYIPVVGLPTKKREMELIWCRPRFPRPTESLRIQPCVPGFCPATTGDGW